jgi:hypothetical protein
MAYAIRTDAAPLSAKIAFPSPPSEVRWVEEPLSVSRAPGPTDTRLFIVARPAAGGRPAWEKTLGDPLSRSGFHLDPALADSLLGAAATAGLALEPAGRSVPGPYYRPSAWATAWYDVVAAVWVDGSLLIELVSK